LFITKLSVFCLTFLALCVIAFFIRPTKKQAKTLPFAVIKKDSLLLHTPSHRIIFVGGSNLSLGLNSNIIKDSLNLNPINTALHADIGLKYMLDHTYKFIKPDDIIIIVPEYHQYYGNILYGNEMLLKVIFGVYKSDYKLSLKQWQHLAPEVINYACTKYNIKSYFSRDNPTYNTDAFNKFGDAVAHWGLKGQLPQAFEEIPGKFNNQSIEELKNFQNGAQKKGASVYIGYPGYQASSFKNSEKEISYIQKELMKNNFKILGTPSRYIVADSLCFDTPYHLTKPAADTRTRLLIADLKKFLF
jgi:hypothetical protein